MPVQDQLDATIAVHHLDAFVFAATVIPLRCMSHTSRSSSEVPAAPNVMSTTHEVHTADCERLRNASEVSFMLGISGPTWRYNAPLTFALQR